MRRESKKQTKKMIKRRKIIRTKCSFQKFEKSIFQMHHQKNHLMRNGSMCMVLFEEDEVICVFGADESKNNKLNKKAH